MNHPFRLFVLFAGLVLAPICMVSTGAGAGPRLVVVVAKGSPITNMSKAELKQVFLSETTALSGHKVIPFNFESKTPQRVAFDQAVLSMSADEVGRFWIDRKIRGQRPAPRAVPSAVYMVKVVQAFPGALGYVFENELPANVQAVTIGGLDYKDAQYSLK